MTNSLMDQRSCPVLVFVSSSCSDAPFSPLHCHCVKVLFPLRQFQTYNSRLLLSGNPIKPTIFLSSQHSILCLCLFNTRWSCLCGIGCLRCDAEISNRWEGERGGYRIEEERRRGPVDGQAKCFGPESIRTDYLLEREKWPKWDGS